MSRILAVLAVVCTAGATSAAPSTPQRTVVVSVRGAEAGDQASWVTWSGVLRYLATFRGLDTVSGPELRLSGDAALADAVDACETVEACVDALDDDEEDQLQGALMLRFEGSASGAPLLTVRYGAIGSDATSGDPVIVDDRALERAFGQRRSRIHAIDGLLGFEVQAERRHLSPSLVASGGAAVSVCVDATQRALVKPLEAALAMELARFGLGTPPPASGCADGQRGCGGDAVCVARGSSASRGYVIAGQVDVTGDAVEVVLELLDLRTSRRVSRIRESVKGPPSELLATLRFAAARLLGVTLEGQGSLMVVANVDEGALSVDGARSQAFPLDGDPLRLQTGKHTVRLSAPDHIDDYREAYVFDGLRRDISLNLAAVEAPEVYEEWWFWTLIGVGVVGGATAGILVSELGASKSEVTVNVVTAP